MIGNKGVKALSEMLKINTLKNLCLYGQQKDKQFHISATKANIFQDCFVKTENHFGYEGAKALSCALKQHPIKKLYLGCERTQA